MKAHQPLLSCSPGQLPLELPLQQSGCPASPQLQPIQLTCTCVFSQGAFAHAVCAPGTDAKPGLFGLHHEQQKSDGIMPCEHSCQPSSTKDHIFFQVDGVRLSGLQTQKQMQFDSLKRSANQLKLVHSTPTTTVICRFMKGFYSLGAGSIGFTSIWQPANVITVCLCNRGSSCMGNMQFKHLNIKGTRLTCMKLVSQPDAAGFACPAH